jgi:hypothetical protein
MAKMTLDELVAQLVKVFGADLRAVVLYGSAAGGEHIAKKSDYNVLVVTDTLTMDHLRTGAAVARAWGDAGNIPPLILTTSEWRSSADIFPMEYADILERHRVLHGTLPLDQIGVAPADLRLQLEHEAMARVLQLRRAILGAGGDANRQLELLSGSLSAMMVVFRAVLRLNGGRPSADYAELSREVATRASFDAAPFLRVIRHVRGEEAMAASQAAEVLPGYLRGAERLVAYLDRYGGGGGGTTGTGG